MLYKIESGEYNLNVAFLYEIEEGMKENGLNVFKQHNISKYDRIYNIKTTILNSEHDIEIFKVGHLMLKGNNLTLKINETKNSTIDLSCIEDIINKFSK